MGTIKKSSLFDQIKSMKYMAMNKSLIQID